MLLSFILMVTVIYVDCNTQKKRHVPNCIEPQQPEEVYNLDGWVALLHLQQCVFVAMGENFYAVFLEKRPRPYDENQEIKDYFLGICDYRTMKKWNLCPLPLETKRKEDCCFKEDNQASPRVHRRLCELSDLSQFGEQCNCDAVLRGEKLFPVTGFPTCYRSQIYDTICGYNNVCGLNSCSMTFISNRVHSIKCDENCFGHKPFCENPEWESSKPREINSFWTDWSEAKCADSDCLAQYNEANCINKDTGLGDVDCLGPGTSCCAGDLTDCKCHVFAEEGMSKVIRTFSVPLEVDYDELSLDEIIKNLPVRNEHRQFKTKEKSKSRQKISRRHSMRDETYDDTYDHAYNIKIIKDNIHAKVQGGQEQKEERDWLHQKSRNMSKKLAARLSYPTNAVEPRDMCPKNIYWFNMSYTPAKIRMRKAIEEADNLPVEKTLKKKEDSEDIEDDTDLELKHLEQDDLDNDEDDIAIEEEDVVTTTTTGSYEQDEIKAAQNYDRTHQNASSAVIDTLGQNVTHAGDSGASLQSYSNIVGVYLIVLFRTVLE